MILNRITSLILVSLFLTTPLTTFARDVSPLPEVEGESEFRDFLIEKTAISGGAELITIFGKFIYHGEQNRGEEKIPLVSVVRDTLGDDIAENDRLRYVWMFTYTRPDIRKNIASAIPFLYGNVGKQTTATSPPPPIVDLSSADRNAWHRTFRSIMFRYLLDSRDWYVRVTARSFRQNGEAYRNVHRLRALAILSLLDGEAGVPDAFTEAEMRAIQARLMLAEKRLGGFVEDQFLDSYYQKQMNRMRDHRGRNWELLRQRAEAEGLYFEPIEMPDGTATHALLWVAKSDLSPGQKRSFNGRFLNISNPWADKRLTEWSGYTQARFVEAGNRLQSPAPEDEDQRRSEAAAATSSDEASPLREPDGRRVEMIPLAVYGLDHPKIPILLVDFRNGLNPKLREASRRALHDISRNLFYASRFGDFRYLLARAAFSFVTSRRGTDINQPSRMRSYSQLKLLLSISDSMNPELKDEVNERLERVSLNPLENDLKAEAELSKAQYVALMEYVQRPDGLPAQLQRDRGVELSNLLNGKWKKAVFGVGNLLSFGIYEHRETVTDVRVARLRTEREVSFHKTLLREAILSGQPIEVTWDIETVRRSLRFLADNAAAVDSQIIRMAEQVFTHTADAETRGLSLLCFYRTNQESAKAALLRIYKDQSLEPRWRAESALYLRKALNEQQRIAPSVAKEIVGAGL